MASADKSAPLLASDDEAKFQFGPPQDQERVVQLFSVLLKTADEQSKAGKHFDVPFAFLLRLANQYKPTLAELRHYHEKREAKSDWPEIMRTIADASRNGASSGMCFDLLGMALDRAHTLDIRGAQLCRVLAAVGQTLGARSAEYRRANRCLAEKYEAPAGQLVPVTPAEQAASRQIRVDVGTPTEIEFRCATEQGGSIVLKTMSLWHASHIGPASGNKSENQDATYAVQLPGHASRDGIVFALADGVTTSMGSRVAANSIVRRFCECAIRRISPHGFIGHEELVEAARETQQSLDWLADALLHGPNSYVFDMVRGSMQEKAAERILENTVNPRSARLPAALSSTLIGGVVQAVGLGEYRAEVMRIGDGVIEQISSASEIASIAVTDPTVTKIREAVSPGPGAREILDNPEERVGIYSVMLRTGESLIVSSDGLTRGHTEPVSRKVAELLVRPFWMDSVNEPDAALKILRAVCRRADEAAQENPDQLLFPDNVSLIMIRCGG
jgi:hypothetical protein